MRLDPTDALEMFDVRFVRTMTHCMQIDTRRGIALAVNTRRGSRRCRRQPIHTHGACRLVDHR